MIIIGFCGATLLFLDNFFLRVLGCTLILFSYFLDLMDGKTARMLNKESPIGKFLDRNYHIPITAVALFGTGYSLYNNSSNILLGINFSEFGVELRIVYLLLGFFCSWLFISKAYLHSAYIHFLRDIRIAQGKKIDPFYQADMNKHLTDHINNFTENKMIRKFYNNFLRLFVDVTDLWFLLFFAVLFQLEKYLLFILIVLYAFLYFINFRRKYRKLCLEESN
jgi:phosphatidylglycerophosphate synthase